MKVALAAIAASPDRSAPRAICPRELLSHRTNLVRFAARRLRDPMLAEDLVHDVFEAVLTGRAVFAGRSSLRSWLTGILKHKIIDLVRRHAGIDSFDDGFDADGATPLCAATPGPDERAEQRERLAQTMARIDALPAMLRDVVQMRIFDELPTAEVCRRLEISEANLFVRLHRARRQLLN